MAGRSERGHSDIGASPYSMAREADQRGGVLVVRVDERSPLRKFTLTSTRRNKWITGRLNHSIDAAILYVNNVFSFDTNKEADPSDHYC